MSRIRLALFPSYDAAVPVRDQLRATGIQAEIHQELQLPGRGRDYARRPPRTRT